ncbi:MAG TPA: ribonuclease T2 [Lamprocystis sp. (in: g-proteobacteria)]|nr:ribonuclease T2 [Lamprocystis sp. (in: g-proteobacteria)]
MHLSRFLIALVLGLLPLAGEAEPFAGSLIAERDCPAGVSTKHQGNPGQVRLVHGETYPVVGRNRAEPTHYLLRIESAQPQDRWVEVGCGRLAAIAAAVEPQPRGAAPPQPGGMDAQFVLAASWQPAFCESRRQRPECAGQTAQRLDARQFSLHGLWPQPIGRAYCGVARPEREASESGAWRRLPATRLTPATRTALEQQMPGAMSQLDRHEWTKHGTCYGQDAETYFRQSLALLGQLNASAVRQVFESNIGKRLRAEEVRSAFDRAFGPGAGARVRLECDPDGQITELRIGLKGVIADGAALGDLVRAAPTRTLGCRGGWVDRAGPGR